MRIEDWDRESIFSTEFSFHLAVALIKEKWGPLGALSICWGKQNPHLEIEKAQFSPLLQ